MNGNRERKSSQSRLFCNLAQAVEGFSHKNFPKCRKTAFGRSPFACSIFLKVLEMAPTTVSRPFLSGEAARSFNSKPVSVLTHVMVNLVGHAYAFYDRLMAQQIPTQNRSRSKIITQGTIILHAARCRAVSNGSPSSRKEPRAPETTRKQNPHCSDAFKIFSRHFQI